MAINYFSLIAKYISIDSLTYRIYVPHVTLVTNKALKIARRLNLSADSLSLIEAGGMLHDVGIVQVQDPEIGCAGDAPYIQHGTIGREIFQKEGLPEIGEFCARHTGVGVTVEDIVEQNLPLPHEDLTPQTIEQKIVCYSDCFFSKDPTKIWLEKDHEEVKTWLSKFPRSKEKIAIFEGWMKEFEGI